MRPLPRAPKLNRSMNPPLNRPCATLSANQRLRG
jgi:hypothetical protein